MEKLHYTNGEVTIVWQPKLCQHSANCVRGLPAVFNSREKPWIKPGGATTQQIVEQVQKCPSGALSFFMNEEKP
ncbi:MAG: (4Fe-4S)-binding protein [Chitinophagales bacterium]